MSSRSRSLATNFSARELVVENELNLQEFSPREGLVMARLIDDIQDLQAGAATESYVKWDDVRTSGLSVQSGASAPDLISFKGHSSVKVYGFNGAGTTPKEDVFFTVQLPHGYDRHSSLFPHVHWAPSTTDLGNVIWQLEYTWANVNGIFPDFVTIRTTPSPASGVAWKNTIGHFPEISGFGMIESSQLYCRLFRDPADSEDTYDHDAAFLEFDFHFQSNKTGTLVPFPT